MQLKFFLILLLPMLFELNSLVASPLQGPQVNGSLVINFKPLDSKAAEKMHTEQCPSNPIKINRKSYFYILSPQYPIVTNIPKNCDYMIQSENAEDKLHMQCKMKTLIIPGCRRNCG